MDFLLRKMQNKRLAVGIASALCLLWAVEIAVYVKPWFKEIHNPNYLDKQHETDLLAPLKAGHEAAHAQARAEYIRTFADNTDGMTLAAMGDVVQLAGQSGDRGGLFRFQG